MAEAGAARGSAGWRAACLGQCRAEKPACREQQMGRDAGLLEKIRCGRNLKLHALFFIYSLTGIVSKCAGSRPFLSAGYCLGYALNMLILAAFTLQWQAVLEKERLGSVYMYKAMTVVWGSVFGRLFFHERLSWKTGLGIGLILAGIYLAGGETADGKGGSI